MVEKFFLGVIIALIYSELTGYVPGGLIVPAFVATSLDRPLKALITLLVALIALAIYRLVSNYFLLFGRRRFVFLVFLGACLSELSLYISRVWSAEGDQISPFSELRALGLIIPGLLASNLERQRFWPTLASFLTVTVMAYFIGRLID